MESAVEKVNVSVYLEAGLVDKAKSLAAADRRPLSSYLAMLIEGGVEVAQRRISAPLPARQMDIAEQIARKVKAGPVRKK
jgi:hypothetical protein